MDRINNSLKPVYHDGNNPYMPTMISIITAKQCARINIDDIELIEQEGRVLHIVTRDKDYAIYENVRTIAHLFEGRSFFQPLKYMIINFDHVRSIESSYVHFQSGQCTTMGKNAFGRTRSAYRKYLDEYPQYAIWNDTVKVAEKH